MHELPGSLSPHVDVPVRRPLGRAGDAARADADGARARAAASSCSAASPARARAASCASSRAEAAGDGALVLYGACDAVVRTPYGPFVEALDHLARVTDPPSCAPRSAPAGGELTRLLPDLPARVGELPPPVKADPDTERHRLHTAVTDLLAGVSRAGRCCSCSRTGTGPTRRRCCCCATSRAPPASARLLLLATFRDTEADVPEALSETLADLRRSDDVVRLRLAGLSDDEVGRVRAPRRGRRPRRRRRPSSRSAIGDLTDGNAFLVCELWRALVETGVVEVVDGAIRLTRPLAELGTPESVREVVSQRLSRLAPRDHRRCSSSPPPPDRSSSSTSSARAAGLAEPELLAALDEAVRSGMIEELPSRALAYRFTHELVRRALYDRLTRRAPRRAAPARRRGARGAPRAARAARSPTSRTTSPPPRRSAAPSAASTTTCCAARAATAALAFDEAAARLRTALELGIESPRRARRGATSSSARASHRAGKALDALEAFTAAAEIARELGDAELLARAAIGYEDACWRPGIADQGAVELLEEAAAALGDESSELRVGLLGGLARALDFQGEHERGAIVRTSAIAMARRLDDRTGLATVLVRSYWSRGTSSLEEILEMLTEAQGPRRGAGRHRDPRRGDGLARADVRRARRPRRRRGGRSAALLRDRRADGAAVHAPRRRALRLGDRAVRRAPRRGRGQGAALARVEPAADRARRRRASTGSRCSASAASRGAWRSSPR